MASTESASAWKADEPDPIACYQKHGFAILPAYDLVETNIIREFAIEWLYRLLEPWVRGRSREFPLETYHLWWSRLGVEHGNLFRAANRHTDAEGQVREALLNQRISQYLAKIGAPGAKLWDAGMGWLAFRLIRPGAGDGYPMTRKEWSVVEGGTAAPPPGRTSKHLISMWIPINGHTNKETLCLVPGSHLREYQRKLPEGGKFVREYRLAEALGPGATYRPNLKLGEIIVYHPRTLHSEDVEDSDITRLNFEVRFNPLPDAS